MKDLPFGNPRFYYTLMNQLKLPAQVYLFVY